MSVIVPINELARNIFKKTLEECDEAELHQLVSQYPYFAPAQLLLAKKMQEENSSSLDEQVQTTSLYFPNRLWLQYLLNGDNINNMAINQWTTGTKEGPAGNKEPAPDPTPVINENKEVQTIDHSSYHEETKESNEEVPAEVPQLINTPAEEPVINENIEGDAIPGTFEEGTISQPEGPIEMRSLRIEPLTAGAGVIFEPYHTVDYFASQGIKFREEEKPQDHFGQQLKSFTEWLKTLKRNPAAETNILTDPVTEKKVEQLAEYSLAERHVITEAMAEVWTKQGNKAKAEEIYRKLSLLDPSKSSYFAAKIEDLKKRS